MSYMPMDTWRSGWQVGREVTPGVAVPATRKVYGTGNIKATTAINRPEVDTGTQARFLGGSARAVTADGAFSSQLDIDNLPEWLACSMRGGVTGAGTGAAKTYTFAVPNNVPLDSMTIERHDGAQVWRGRGFRVNSYTIAGDVGGDLTLSAALFGVDVETMPGNALTPAVPDYAPAYTGGWEAQIYLDDLGVAPGTTLVADFVGKLGFTCGTNLGRRHLANNTRATTRIIPGVLAASGSLSVAADARAMAEYAKHLGGIPRLLRIVLGNNAVIGAGPDKKKVTIDLPALITADNTEADAEGERMHDLTFEYIMDPVNAFASRVAVVSSRTALFA